MLNTVVAEYIYATSNNIRLLIGNCCFLLRVCDELNLLHCLL